MFEYIKMADIGIADSYSLLCVNRDDGEKKQQ